MKKFLNRIIVLLILSGLGLGNVAQAQHRSHSHSPRHTSSHHSSGFHDAMRTINDIAEVALFASMLHHFDNYTGLRIGYNAASLRTSGFGGDVSSSFNSGVNAGVVFGWYLGRSPLIVEPGIFYSMKGGTLEGYNWSSREKSTIDATMHMIEIPLVFKYDLMLDKGDNNLASGGIALQPFFGGFMAFGCGGQSKDSYYRETYETFGSGDDQFDSFDAGLRMGVGLCVDHFYIELAYDLGLVNLPNRHYGNFDYDSYSDGIRSNTLGINLGFNF